MRLWVPVLHIARQADASLPAPVPVSSGGKTYTIPPNTIIYVNSAGIHTDRKIWGEDALDFNPARWLVPSDPSDEKSTQTIKQMPKGTYLSWSQGPRNCPGMKMSQVEFVSVFATVFRRYRVEVVRRDGEGIEEMKRRVRGIMADSQSRLTLQMNRPKEIEVRFVKR
jgi:cytochrome P450